MYYCAQMILIETGSLTVMGAIAMVTGVFFMPCFECKQIFYVQFVEVVCWSINSTSLSA